jgi:hypothetical protein
MRGSEAQPDATKAANVMANMAFFFIAPVPLVGARYLGALPRQNDIGHSAVEKQQALIKCYIKDI